MFGASARFRASALIRYDSVGLHHMLERRWRENLSHFANTIGHLTFRPTPLRFIMLYRLSIPTPGLCSSLATPACALAETETYFEIAAGVSASERGRLFAANAARYYALDLPQP